METYINDLGTSIDELQRPLWVLIIIVGLGFMASIVNSLVLYERVLVKTIALHVEGQHILDMPL